MFLVTVVPLDYVCVNLKITDCGCGLGTKQSLTNLNLVYDNQIINRCKYQTWNTKQVDTIRQNTQDIPRWNSSMKYP